MLGKLIVLCAIGGKSIDTWQCYQFCHNRVSRQFDWKETDKKKDRSMQQEQSNMN